MFKDYDPLQDRLFQVMDDDGKLLDPALKPNIPEQQIITAYKAMQFARTADLMAVSYQRQGRMFTYPPNLGQEAISAAAGQIMRQQDWLVPTFREMGAYLAKGAKLSDLFLFWGGYEDGSLFSGAPNFIPSAVPIASQLPHAVGIGYAVTYKKEDSVVFAFVGDGGTSAGDFHEALNFAAVWRTPVIFIIQNNQYAISVPVKKQTASLNLAVKATAYGMPGIKADGNDYFAMYAVIAEAFEHARQGNGPVLIEAVTFRRGAHTTSDDPTLYRTEEEEKQWEAKDPIKRLRQYLIAHELWQEADDEPLLEQFKKEVEKEFAVYESHPAYRLEDVFRFVYKDMPLDLKRQQVEYEKFLNSREVRK